MGQCSFTKASVRVRSFSQLLVLMCAAGWCGWGGGCTSSQGRSEQATFATPDEGADALISAVRRGDEGRVHKILGPGAEDVVSSGDPIADRENREDFIEMYDEAHQLERKPDGSTILVVGHNDWPMPIPMVEGRDGWRFDVERGADEMISRRVGRNELTAMEVSRAIVDAQKEYAEGEGRGTYAAQILSDPGTRNGLYWPAEPGVPESPLGPLVAEAQSEGYTTERTRGDKAPRPYHGYFYRILTAQGPSAPGGERSYMSSGRLTNFAVIAYPANYGHSGVMTFLTGRNGIVFERDLGSDGTAEAGSITRYDPDLRWKVAD